MYRKIQQLKNVAEITINPATETTLQYLVDANTTLSPVTFAPIATSDVRTSYTVTVGNNLVLTNGGNKIVAWGGPTVTYATGQKLVPTQEREWLGVETGFKIYLVNNTGETSTILPCEQ
jgi:hypothetical protein